MSTISQNFRSKFAKLVKELGTPSRDDVEKYVWSEIDSLCSDGTIKLADDYLLGGDALEFRTKQILREMKLYPEDGRKGHEDIVVKPCDEFEIQIPLVCEVKSGDKPAIARRDLRQLDDWVFDLSGEEGARKKGLGQPLLAIATNGHLGATGRHPTPHKGAIIFNRSRGTPFEQRQNECVGANEILFADNHNLCLIPFELLIWSAKAVKTEELKLEHFWNTVHQCAGVLTESTLLADKDARK